MLLTYGNIRKSKVLKYNFLVDVENEEYLEKYREYHKSIENGDFWDYLKIEPYLHDAQVSILTIGSDIVFELEYWDDHEGTTKTGTLTFRKASIVSWNKFRKSGHIARLNKKYLPQEYGYDEFYEERGEKFVSIIFFSRKRGSKRPAGTYYPMMTMKYSRIEYA